MADRPYRRTLQASAKERVLVELMLLEHPMTVEAIRGGLEVVFGGQAPRRQTIYDDLTCIETIHPLEVRMEGHKKTYKIANRR